jgi:hypothetical protein
MVVLNGFEPQIRRRRLGHFRENGFRDFMTKGLSGEEQAYFIDCSTSLSQARLHRMSGSMRR